MQNYHLKNYLNFFIKSIIFFIKSYLCAKKNFSVILCAGSSFRKMVQFSMDRVINRKQWNKKTTFSWTFTEIDLGEDLNCKFKTFGFLDSLKVHIQSNYITSTTAKISDYQMPND